MRSMLKKKSQVSNCMWLLMQGGDLAKGIWGATIARGGWVGGAK